MRACITTSPWRSNSQTICPPPSRSGRRRFASIPSWPTPTTAWESLCGSREIFPAPAEQLRQAIQIRPDYAEAHYTLGTVLKQMNQLPEAAEALRQAIRLDPDFAGAHTTLAAVLRQLGDSAGAAAESKAGAEIVNQKNNLQAATFATNSGRRLLGAGDLDGAISQFRTAIRVMPSYALAHYELGLALSQKGLKDEASGEYRKAAELDPHLVPPVATPH